ncbi:MAG: hypothetical protein WCF36_19500 [Candidatus Nanopelagicales bacterium]
MSSGAGGEVIGLVVVGAAAGAVVIAAGLVVGVGYCAVGIARGTAAAGRAANHAWEDHEQARALEARLLALEGERWANYLAVRTAFDAACADAGVEPTDLVPGPYPDPSSDVARIQQAIGLMAAATGRLTRELAALAAVTHSKALAAALAHESTTTAARAHEAITTATDSLARRAVDLEADRRAVQAIAVAEAVAQLRAAQDANLRQRTARALSELPEDADTDTIGQVQGWLSQIGDLTGDRLAEAASALETLCGQAASQSAVRALQDEHAGALIAALAGCGTPRGKELVEQARAYLVGERPWDPDLLGRAKAELDRVQSEFDDLYAASVLAGSLADLGYELGPAFVADAISEEGAYAGHPDWPQHLIHVEYDVGTREVDLDVVRVGDPRLASSRAERRADVQVEREFCEDLDSLLESARDQGVIVRIDERIEPGVEPVDRVEVAQGKKRETRRKRKKERQRQMQLDGRNG